MRVSKKSVCCVMIRDANQVRRVDQEHLGVGIVKAVGALCDFGPSLFGIRA